MYVHAYQSLVWNKVVSERIKRFGDKVLIGDFVQQEDVESKPNQIESKLEKIKSQLIVVTENNIEKYSLLGKNIYRYYYLKLWLKLTSVKKAT